MNAPAALPERAAAVLAALRDTLDPTVLEAGPFDPRHLTPAATACCASA